MKADVDSCLLEPKILDILPENKDKVCNMSNIKQLNKNYKFLIAGAFVNSYLVYVCDIKNAVDI